MQTLKLKNKLTFFGRFFGRKFFYGVFWQIKASPTLHMIRIHLENSRQKRPPIPNLCPRASPPQHPTSKKWVRPIFYFSQAPFSFGRQVRPAHRCSLPHSPLWARAPRFRAATGKKKKATVRSNATVAFLGGFGGRMRRSDGKGAYSHDHRTSPSSDGGIRVYTCLQTCVDGEAGRRGAIRKGGNELNR